MSLYPLLCYLYVGIHTCTSIGYEPNCKLNLKTKIKDCSCVLVFYNIYMHMHIYMLVC
jgi:hypothetical protein